ncbi:synaptosomal-associated protein 47-like [Mizuhopecten yessoensis]|uniref:synaptosomal-associated protein 47-like n=1 Tax=Mizuhopecten yessoensis TaxID=6573 RepID=UPI000B45BDAC|nr:synaptosomal-associated protein 47-like [Mizuhopecten yessoensis]
MADFGQLHVREWEVQFYQEQTRKWLTGMLSVTVERIIFQDKNSQFNMICMYGDFAEVKKTTTGIIFSAIVIITKDGKKHWFSSLPNREDIFNVMQYFLRSNVTFSDQGNKGKTLGMGRTEMGHKLLKVAYDSHKTLSASAEIMSSQGEQIDSTLTAMTDIHNDLDIAESLTSGMESWTGKWRIPNVYQTVDPIIVHQRDIPNISDYEILYTKMETNKTTTQKLGLLRIAPEGMFILSEKQKLIHHFKWSDISRVRVLSPCEVLVTRFLIGQPDLSYGVVCTSLLGFLEFLERKMRSKIEYVTSGFVRQPEERGHPQAKITKGKYTLMTQAKITTGKYTLMSQAKITKGKYTLMTQAMITKGKYTLMSQAKLTKGKYTLMTQAKITKGKYTLMTQAKITKGKYTLMTQAKITKGKYTLMTPA